MVEADGRLVGVRLPMVILPILTVLPLVVTISPQEATASSSRPTRSPHHNTASHRVREM